MKNIHPQLHEEILTFLLEKRKKDKDLYFQLRDNNGGDFLAKGYWFWGGEKDVIITFWQFNNGNVFCRINANNTKTIAFSHIIGYSYDEKIKKELFEYIAEKINASLIGEGNVGKIKSWQKEYKKGNYIEVLNFILENDKKNIDGIGRDYLEHTEKEPPSINFIDPKRFHKNLAQVQQYRKKIILNNPLKLAYLSLENIGHFSNISIDLSKKVTCIIGENGLGKSTIIRAIALALVGTKQNNLINTAAKSLQNLLKIKKIDKDGKRYYANSGEITVGYQLNKLYINTIRLSDGGLTGIQFEDVDVDVLEEDNFLLAENNYFEHLIIGFPQGQGRNEKPNLTFAKEAKPNAYDVLPLIMNYPDDRLNQFKLWLEKMYSVYLQNKERKETAKELRLIHKIFRIISLVTSENTNPKAIEFVTVAYHYSADNEVIIKTTDNPNGITIDLLSQDLSNVFSWVGFFMMRLMQANPDMEDISKAHAIVLIDEIDTYLHPKWQRNILKVLADEFPNVQFVVTTHSPMVLGNLNTKNEDGKDDFLIYKFKLNAENQINAYELAPEDLKLYGADVSRIFDLGKTS